MNTRSLRMSIAAAMGGAVLLAGLLVGASFALAQEDDQPEPTETETEESVDGDCLEHGFGFLKDRTHLWSGNLDDVFAELDLTMEELKDLIADGATLEEIAAEAGIDLDAVLADLRADALASVDDAVAEGDLTEEQGDAIRERIESFNLEDGGLFGPRGFGFNPDRFGLDDLNFEGHRFGFGSFGGFGDLGDMLSGVDIDALREQLESGATLDEILDAAGIDVEELATQAREEALAHLDQMVADGHISQERADSMKEMLEGIDFSDGLPFGFGGFRLGDGLPRFDMDGFEGRRGHGHGFGFFGGDDVDEDGNAEETLQDA